ncbi:DUF465 domain-containing protein [Alteraurantiacibacter aquimixticola]|uniref:DUF465 domain-containing protein n=1 Tax=Alteraurantiacibacter aquimixticola TaxID=2489173 RepID=UPI00145A6F44|nr:DUF465 domain-containing protein [Alteraurantiacibacter aquimixticola]
MTARLYRLNEMHQRIDSRLRAALQRANADPLELTRLTAMKRRVKELIHKLSPRPVAG